MQCPILKTFAPKLIWKDPGQQIVGNNKKSILNYWPTNWFISIRWVTYFISWFTLCHFKFAGQFFIALLRYSWRAVGELFIILEYCFTNGRRAINSSPQLHFRRAMASDHSLSLQKAKPADLYIEIKHPLCLIGLGAKRSYLYLSILRKTTLKTLAIFKLIIQR